MTPSTDVDHFVCVGCGEVASEPARERGVFARKCATCMAPFRAKAEAFLTQHPKEPPCLRKKKRRR